MIVKAKAKVLLFICDLSSACLHINIYAMSPHLAIRQTQHSHGPKNNKLKQFIFISSQSHPWIFFNYMLLMSCPIYFLATSFPLFVFSLINKNERLKKKKKKDWCLCADHVRPTDISLLMLIILLLLCFHNFTKCLEYSPEYHVSHGFRFHVLIVRFIFIT